MRVKIRRISILRTLQVNCQRKACGNPLTHGYYNIDNDGSVEGRNYCPKCGLGIVESNPGIKFSVYDRAGTMIRNNDYMDGQRLAELDWDKDTIAEQFDNDWFELGYATKIKELSVQSNLKNMSNEQIDLLREYF